MPSDSETRILLVDDVKREGLVSTLKASGIKYVHVSLEDAVDWEAAFRRVPLDSMDAVIGKLSIPSLVNLGSDEFVDVNVRLLNTLARRPNLIFIHADLFSGRAFDDAVDAEASGRGPVHIGSAMLPRHELLALRRGVELLKASGLGVLAYRTLPEVTVAAETFVLEADSGLLFRVYMPAGRLYEDQFDRVLNLFREYLQRIAGISVRADTVKTDSGVIHAFYGQGILPAETPAKFAEFSDFFDVCSRDTEEAERILRSHGFEYREVVHIVTRYSKEARRVALDMRQDRETKLLAIRHRLEAELSEIEPMDPDEVTRLVDSVIPNVIRVAPSFGNQEALTLRRPLLEVNVGSVVIERLQNVVSDTFNGDVNLTDHDARLIELFESYGDTEARSLISALYELKDASAPIGNRATAKQRIRTFLLKVGEKVSDLALGVLQAYIEKSLML